MARGSLPGVDVQAMPAIVESPTNETGGASAGGVAAAAGRAEPATGNEAQSTTMAAANVDRWWARRVELSVFFRSGELDIAAVLPN